MANEKRLIDANALKSTLGDLEATGGHKYYRQGADCVLHEIMPQVIDDEPTVDAVEVVHGRWRAETEEEQPNIAMRQVVCSVCNGRAHGRYNYCPNCGAKMDLE